MNRNPINQKFGFELNKNQNKCNSLLYKSNLGEIKTLREWIGFVNRHDAWYANSPAHNKIKIVTKNIFVEEVVRELTEFKLFKERRNVPVLHNTNS